MSATEELMTSAISDARFRPGFGFCRDRRGLSAPSSATAAKHFTDAIQLATAVIDDVRLLQRGTVDRASPFTNRNYGTTTRCPVPTRETNGVSDQ